MGKAFMKKSILTATLFLILMVASLGSHATTFSTEIRTCPIGGETFTTEVIMSYSIFGRRLDLKPRGTYASDPRPLIVCPNGFVDFADSYTEEELTKFTELINSKEYQRLRSGNTNYYLFAKILEHINEDKQTTAWLYLNASWEAENKNNSSQYVRYLNLAINDLSEAKSEGWVDFMPRFLLAELNRLKGDFESALFHLEDLEANWSAKDYELVLIEFEKELIKNNNSKPMMQPKG